MQPTNGHWRRAGGHIILDLGPHRGGQPLTERFGDLARSGATDEELAGEILAELEIEPELWSSLKRGAQRMMMIGRILNLTLNPLPGDVAPPPQRPPIEQRSKRVPTEPAGQRPPL